MSTHMRNTALSLSRIIHTSKFVTELRPLIDVRISFSLNIFRKNGQTLTKFCIHIIIDNIYVEIFRKFVTEFRLLVNVRVLFPLNSLRKN